MAFSPRPAAAVISLADALWFWQGCVVIVAHEPGPWRSTRVRVRRPPLRARARERRATRVSRDGRAEDLRGSESRAGCFCFSGEPLREDEYGSGRRGDAYKKYANNRETFQISMGDAPLKHCCGAIGRSKIMLARTGRRCCAL